MHGVSEARENSHFRHVLDSADLVVADGMPLVWLGRWQGHNKMKRRVYGPELMETFAARLVPSIGTSSTAGRWSSGSLAQVEHERYGIQIAGTYCPPFRPLTEEEEREVQRAVEAAAPDVLWVGLSTPKQEQWMYAHRDKLQVPVMLGVGAAFDLNTGRLTQAPAWMRENVSNGCFVCARNPGGLWSRIS